MQVNRILHYNHLNLNNGDYIFIEAEDGAQAIAKLAENPDICLILSDVNMPVMDGMSMLRAMRVIGKYNHIPIVMLTTESSAELVTVAKSLGAIGWLIKPFKPEMLAGAVRKVIDTHYKLKGKVAA